jgi:1-acyl-sn-glycerol-3-phosphate acyltransferase
VSTAAIDPSFSSSNDKNDKPARPEVVERPRARRPGGVRHRIADAVLRLGGWKADGDPPDLDKFVIIAAPHTALVDGFWMNAFAWYYGVEIRWLVKASAAVGPMRWVLDNVGAVLVDRSQSHNLVAHLAEEFRRRESLALAIAPEGTRSSGKLWKSGFYHVARGANVPICMSYLDYGRKRGGFGPCFKLSGDVRADMDVVRAFYADVTAKDPSKFTPPRLKEEAAE